MAGSFAASASVLDVSAASSAWWPAGGQLAFDVSIANFAASNPGAPRPTQLAFQLLAQAGQGPLASLPGSTSQYYTGFELAGQLGSTPFADPAAARAGFGAGTLLLDAGWLATGSGTRPIALIDGTAAASPDQTILRILLTNLGADLWVGAGDGYTLKTSFLLAVSGGSGTVQTTGLVQDAWLDVPSGGGGPLATPEPNSGALLLVPLVGAALALFGYHLLARAWKNLSSKHGSTSTSVR